MYVRDPHVLLSLAPQDIFLDPSHTYRLWLEKYEGSFDPPRGFYIRKITSNSDIKSVNKIYTKVGMPALDTDFFTRKRTKKSVTAFVVEKKDNQEILGVVMGIDHYFAFKDPENGSSLWSLAVDPDAPFPAIGTLLIHHVVRFFQGRGRAFLDLIVMHDNKNAIKLYEKMGFERVPYFCVEPKRSTSEKYYTSPGFTAGFSPHAKILINEAKKRGIKTDFLEGKNTFKLSFGGREVDCYESLSSFTTAMAYRRCRNKLLMNSFLKKEVFLCLNKKKWSQKLRQRNFLKNIKL